MSLPPDNWLVLLEEKFSAEEFRGWMIEWEPRSDRSSARKVQSWTAFSVLLIVACAQRLDHH